MPPEELLNTYLPQFSGILDAYAGRNNIHFHSEYIGAAVLVLAGLGIGAAARHRRFAWFWVGALVVSTLWALGGFTPFYHLVYALVPGTKFFRAPSTMLYVVSFCTAVLAALGTERALSLRARPRYLYAWIGFAAFMALLATGGMLTNMAAGFANPALQPRVDANARALTLGGWRSLLAVSRCRPCSSPCCAAGSDPLPPAGRWPASWRWICGRSSGSTGASRHLPRSCSRATRWSTTSARAPTPAV
jgi:hypothetical protein